MSEEDKQNSGSSSSQLNQFNSDQEVNSSTLQTNLQLPASLSASSTTATPILQMSSLSTGTSTTSSLSAPPKLGATDAASFADWKVRFKAYCMMVGLYEVVTTKYEEYLNQLVDNEKAGGGTRPKAVIANQLKQQHQKAFGAIVLAVSEVTGTGLISEMEIEQSGQVGFIATNANLLWVKLEQVYEKKTIYSILHVWQKLFSLQYVDGQNPLEFKKVFDQFILQLNQIDDPVKPGQKLSEGFKAAIWLNALPASLESTSQTLLLEPKVEIDEIYQALIRRYESNIDTKSKPRAGTEVANIAVTSGGGSSTSGYRSKLTCHHCKKVGHIKANCYKLNGFPATHPGHPDHPEHNKSGGNKETSFCLVETIPTDSDEYEEEVQQEVTNAATDDGQLYVSGREEFILDSGASRHMVYDKSLMFDTIEVHPIRFTGIMKKSVIVNEVGSVRLSDTVKLNGVAHVGVAGANLVSVAKVLDAGLQIEVV